MSKPIGIGQSHSVMQALANNVDWAALAGYSEALQSIIEKPREAGEQFTVFLQNGGRVIVGEPKIIKIDRSKPFDPATFLGPGWTIWRGPADGNGLEEEEEQDKRSLALTEVDLTKVLLETGLLPGQTSITGEERLNRLKAAGHIRLDAQVFWTLWNNKLLIPERLKEQTGDKTTFIFFDGTTLRGPDGYRYALYLYEDVGQWCWRYVWLGRVRGASGPSAVLAS